MSSWNDIVSGRHDRVLIGGFECALSADDVNQWTEYVTATAEFKRLQEACIQLDAAELAVADLEHCQEVVREREYAYHELYAVGKAWYAGLVEHRCDRRAHRT